MDRTIIKKAYSLHLKIVKLEKQIKKIAKLRGVSHINYKDDDSYYVETVQINSFAVTSKTLNKIKEFTKFEMLAELASKLEKAENNLNNLGVQLRKGEWEKEIKKK